MGLETEGVDLLWGRPDPGDDPDAQDRLWEGLAGSVLADPEVPFARHWDTYRRVFRDRRAADGPPRAWRPDRATVEQAQTTALQRALGLPDYAALHAWSAADRAGYWGRVAEEIGVPFHTRAEAVLEPEAGPEHARWFPGARLNAAALCFQAPQDRVAIVAGREGKEGLHRITYGELKALADRASHGYLALGLKEGDAVALYMPMTVECVAAYLGAVQAGLAVVSIPDSFAVPEVTTRLRLGDAKAIVTVDALRRGGKAHPLYAKAAQSAQAQGGLPCIVVADREPEPWRDGDLLWRGFLGPEEEPFAQAPCAPDAVSNVLFSSGTTGEPKAIPWTHLTPLKCAADGRFHQDIHDSDVVAWPTNIGWMMGPWLIYASLANRATMALYEGAPTGKGFLEFVRASGVTVLGVVPSIVRAWRAAGVVDPHGLPGVRVFSSTGEASNAEDYLFLMSLASYRAPVIEYCGGTEVGGGHITGTVVQAASPATFTTPALGLDFVVLDDAGKEVPQGGMGELFLVPPSVGLSQRLLNRDHHEEYHSGCPEGPRGQTLRRHGDEVQRLAKGFWCAQGRADDTMNLGGIKVASVELERVMDAHDAVRESAAVAVPPPGGGAERLVVHVVPAQGGTDPERLRQELQERIKERLNPLFRIHDLVLAEALPRTASNKVMRRELRRRYLEPEPAGGPGRR